MVAFADRDAARDVTETYQYDVGASSFHFEVDRGDVRVHDGRAKDPVVTWTTDEDTWAGMASGDLSADQAIAAGRLAVTGDRQAARRLRTIFSRTSMLAGRPPVRSDRAAQPGRRRS
jgi:putative sterol carrier protein